MLYSVQESRLLTPNVRTRKSTFRRVGVEVDFASVASCARDFIEERFPNKAYYSRKTSCNLNSSIQGENQEDVGFFAHRPWQEGLRFNKTHRPWQEYLSCHFCLEFDEID